MQAEKSANANRFDAFATVHFESSFFILFARICSFSFYLILFENGAKIEEATAKKRERSAQKLIKLTFFRTGYFWQTQNYAIKNVELYTEKAKREAKQALVHGKLFIAKF